jgi:1,4-dihydroxy-2-naphthoate octaprenyltransferase
MNFAAIGVSGVLGLFAAQQGSKWWIAILCVIVAGFVIGLYFTAHSFRLSLIRLTVEIS